MSGYEDTRAGRITRQITKELIKHPDKIRDILEEIGIEHYTYNPRKKTYKIMSCPACKKHACMIICNEKVEPGQLEVFWFCFRTHEKEKFRDTSTPPCHKKYHFSLIGLISAKTKYDFDTCEIIVRKVLGWNDVMEEIDCIVPF